MSGKFLDPEPYTEPHTCSRPSSSGLAVGTRWQCDCGNIYRVEPFKAYGKSVHWVLQNRKAVNGVHRLVIDDATVERAARALCESIWKLPNAWELSEDYSKDSYRAHARTMLAAAVKEGGE